MKGIANECAVGISAYASPRCFVTEFNAEGVLCLSGLYGGGYHDGIYGDDEETLI